MTAIAPVECAGLGRRTAPAPRLLPEDGEGTSWRVHLERYGVLPALDGRAEDLRRAVDASGLTGRGGGGFPSAVKLRAVSERGRSIVVANGTEGEPASAKDKTLLARNPHLVLDGMLVAMEAAGGREGIVALARADRTGRTSLEAALRERRTQMRAVRIATVPDRFVAGEESALVQRLNGGDAKPTVTPPRPFERGVNGRPTLVQNVETIANLGLIARFGAGWFRDAGLDDEPGTVLATVLGAVRQPVVVEVALGTPLRRVVELAGGATARPQALLVGGYFGAWIPAEAGLDAPLAERGLRPLGAALGARTIAVLPHGVCGVVETARVVSYLAGESAGQCGPCVFGLPAVAEALDVIARRGSAAGDALARLPRLEIQIAGRGACAHPDGVLRLVASARSVFAAEIERHLVGRCSASGRTPFLPTPVQTGAWR